MTFRNPVTSLCRYVTCTTIGLYRVKRIVRKVCSSELEDEVPEGTKYGQLAKNSHLVQNKFHSNLSCTAHLATP
jgi:hypothetical protein